MVGLPSGTVTFLFTDIEGSTRLWELHPQTMRQALARHDQIVRGAIDRHHGAVFATGGDGFAASFATSRDALNAAVDAQRAVQSEPWPDGVDLAVRMGIHTGEVDERDGDYFGPAVNRAARLMAAANGGQIFMSGVTTVLLGQVPDVDLEDLGLHRLKGVGEPMRLFSVSTAGLQPVDRPPRTDPGAPGNLPRPATEFVGDIDHIRSLAGEVAEHRLVTLIGPGGVGKTRQSIEIGWMSAGAFADGVHLIELAPISEPTTMVASVAASLAVQAQPGASLMSSVVDRLRGQRLLVILDNCEHLLDVTAELVAAIIAGCTTVNVLATSREPLGIPGERVVSVRSLSTADAAELFCVRAVAADHALVFDESDRRQIENICDRVDGIPLAIELAAARVRSLTLTDIATRLDDRFRLLRGASRAGLERHQTLRAAVTWSYRLLSDIEQQLFDRISVFAGDFDVAAAEVVCTGDLVEHDNVVDLLGGLVDKSMLVADRTDRSVRYRMLETLRQYGEERLADSGQGATYRDRHLAHYVTLAIDARVVRLSRRQLEGDEMFDRAWDNIRAAQAWAVASGALDAADRLLAASIGFAWHRLRHEFGDWADRLIATDSMTPARATSTYHAATAFAVLSSDWQRIIDMARIGIERNSDDDNVAKCWQDMSFALSATNLPDQAIEANREARTRAIDANDVEARWMVEFGRVVVAPDTGSMRQAVDDLSVLAAEFGVPWMLAEAYEKRGDLCLRERDYAGALKAYRAGRALAVDTSVQGEGSNAAGIVIASLAETDSSFTGECGDMIRRVYDTGNWLGLWNAVRAVAWFLARNGEVEQAATVLGHVDAHTTPWGRDFSWTASMVDSHPMADEWRARGAAMTREQLVAYVLDVAPSMT